MSSMMDLGLAASEGLTIADLPPEVPGVRMELINGSLLVTPLGDVDHQLIIMRLCRRLQPPDGLEVLPGVNVILNDATLLIPDVAVIDPQCIVRNGLGVSPSGLRLVVEVTSRSTRIHDLTAKRELYRQWCVPYVVIDRADGQQVAQIGEDLPSWARAAFQG